MGGWRLALYLVLKLLISIFVVVGQYRINWSYCQTSWIQLWHYSINMVFSVQDIIYNNHKNFEQVVLEIQWLLQQTLMLLKFLVMNSKHWVLLQFKDNGLVLHHLFISINISFITILRCVSLELVTIILVSYSNKMTLASLVAILGKLLI
jgi:hypothetical protein